MKNIKTADNSDFFKALLEYLENDEMEDALEFAKERIYQSKDIDLALRVAEYFEDYDIYESIEVYKVIIDLDKSCYIAYENIGYHYQDLDYFKESDEYLELALKVAKENLEKLDNSQNRLNLANAYYSLNRDDIALDYYNKALELEPYSKDINFKLGQIYFSYYYRFAKDEKREDYLKKSILYYENILKVDSNDIYVYKNIVTTYRLLQEYQKLIEIYQKLIDLDKEQKSNYLIAIAKTYKDDLNDREKALEFYKKVFETEHLNHSTAMQLKDGFLDLEEPNLALEMLNRVQKKTLYHPLNLDLDLEKALIFFKLQKRDEALALLRKVLKLDKNRVDRAVEILKEQKEYKEAVNILKEFPKWDKKKLYKELGVIYFKYLNDEVEATKNFTKMLKLNPSYFRYDYNNFIEIGKIFYLDIEDKVKAFEYFQKAIDLNPKDFNVYERLNWFYEYKKEIDSLIKNLLKLIELKPTNAEYYKKLGYTYLNLSDLENAKFYLQKALELAPKDNYIMLNLLEINLVKDEPFNRELKERYLNLFRDDEKKLAYFKVLQSLKSIQSGKADEFTQIYPKKYSYIAEDWDFSNINRWIERQDKEIKKSLIKAIYVFEDRYRV